MMALSLFNPWVLLTLGIALAGSNFYSYSLGGDHKENEAKAAYSKQLESSIKEANENALIDMQAAREVGEREGRARARTVVIEGKAQVVFRDNPQPRVCDWTTPAFGVLNDAIQAANDLKATPIAVPDSGPRLKPPSKPAR